MLKVYIYDERKIFLNDGLKAGLSQEEVERQINELDELNTYRIELEELSLGTLCKVWKNNKRISLKELDSYEKGYFHQAMASFQLENKNCYFN